MKFMLQATGVLLALGIPLPSLGAETLTIKVVVKLREKADDLSGKPFSDVGGFALRRNAVTYSKASCPDLSDAQGAFACKVQCDATDGDMRLQLVSPGRELARIVAGFSPPSLQAVEVSACKVKTKLPIVVIYRSLDVIFSEFRAANPEVYNTLKSEGAGAHLKLKPFSTVASALEVMAKEPSKRGALLEFSRVASAYEESPAELRPIEFANIDQYASGLNSIVLKALAAQTDDTQLGSAVKISSSNADLVRSINAVDRKLNAKAVLSAPEIVLSDAVRDIKAQPSQVSERLEKANAKMRLNQF